MSTVTAAVGGGGGEGEGGGIAQEDLDMRDVEAKDDGGGDDGDGDAVVRDVQTDDAMGVGGIETDGHEGVNGSMKDTTAITTTETTAAAATAATTATAAAAAAAADAAETTTASLMPATAQDVVAVYKPISFAGNIETTIKVYDLTNYAFGVKTPQKGKTTSNEARFAKMKNKYYQQGMRRGVSGVMLVHQHTHPHVLLLQTKANESLMQVPGGSLQPGETDDSGLSRKLISKLSPEGTIQGDDDELVWEVGPLMCKWWRPHFAREQYPYLPPHITKPRECRKQFVVHMPERYTFAVPSNLKIVAVPLFELYDNPYRYGTLVAAIPQLLSRFNLVCV
eukprot:TRINITY_DN302_c0_g1_i1.p1 TRINITY_DN302_c0_g1~~TRINITY_DN302_c0_g1_i1.p1  ORF type:complete len:337 (+),score=104.67 TRINITY_DN302_c0_g1_i1:151-1161(+)